ncbi:MAG: hypothetical protein J0H31_26150, partial [Alphaproteobacteria bacterium]|nr:hypothetical protein [Alphaproteobacteria bacterium]
MADERKINAGRFAALADAYGGALHRWPQVEQPGAMLFAETAEGRAILRRAGRLDAILDRHRAEAPGSALHRAIVAGATAGVRQGRRRRYWWLGFGLA